MILSQFLHTDPIAASYFVACAGHAAAAVVDPVGDIAPYRALAEATGTKIRYVIDMRLHADHVSAARDLTSATGADYVLFADAKVGFPFHGVRDGELLDLGNVSIKVLHTPGHTPEHHFTRCHRPHAWRRTVVRPDRHGVRCLLPDMARTVA